MKVADAYSYFKCSKSLDFSLIIRTSVKNINFVMFPIDDVSNVCFQSNYYPSELPNFVAKNPDGHSYYGVLFPVTQL